MGFWPIKGKYVDGEKKKILINMNCGLFNNIVPTLTSGFRSLYYAYGKMVTLGKLGERYTDILCIIF